MNFKELLQQTKWSDIFTSMVRDDEDIDEQHYKKMYFNLLATEPTITDEKLVIVVDIIVDPEGDYLDVSGMNEKGERYSLSLTTWDKWLGFEVDIGNLHPVDFITACIWEMTFYGDEVGLSETIEKLDKVAEKIDNQRFLIHEKDCSLCNGDGELFGNKCICTNGKISVMKEMKD